MSRDTVRVFAISKLRWIRQQRRKLEAQEREAPRENIDRESHYVWGQRYLLAVEVVNAPPEVRLAARKMLMRVRPGADIGRKKALLAQWYRDQIKAAVPGLIAKWAPVLGVRVDGFFVQQMKTKWGSCNPDKRRIRLNTELAKKPRECLEYIVVHEMAHLREPTHNERFVGLMDEVLPQWRYRRRELNRLPVRHEDWDY
jgi:predicted metal-dependent hydrolase